MLWSMGSRRVGHDLTTKQQQCSLLLLLSDIPGREQISGLLPTVGLSAFIDVGCFHVSWRTVAVSSSEEEMRGQISVLSFQSLGFHPSVFPDRSGEPLPVV